MGGWESSLSSGVTSETGNNLSGKKDTYARESRNVKNVRNVKNASNPRVFPY